MAKYDITDRSGGKIGELRVEPDYEGRAAQAAGNVAGTLIIWLLFGVFLLLWWMLRVFPLGLAVVVGVAALWSRSLPPDDDLHATEPALATMGTVAALLVVWQVIVYVTWYRREHPKPQPAGGVPKRTSVRERPWTGDLDFGIAVGVIIIISILILPLIL